LQATLDTSFFILHYFSKDPAVLKKSKAVLHYCRLAGNAGVLPSIVLAESLAYTWKHAGRQVAEHRYREMIDSGLKIIPLTREMARESGTLRAKYQEKIPWGDCLIAGTHIVEDADVIVSEDPHFKDVKEVKAKTLDELKV
jgi:predicted nucleic acid-binding protein